MSRHVIKNSSGSYFVAGRGFVGESEQEGTSYTKDSGNQAVSCIGSLGFGSGSLVEVKSSSFAVVHIRKGDVDGVKVSKRSPNGAMNERDPSRRRFETVEEARAHGARYHVRRAYRKDPPGTAGHQGYFVIETNDPVNAKVNWKTGLTNPVK